MPLSLTARTAGCDSDGDTPALHSNGRNNTEGAEHRALQHEHHSSLFAGRQQKEFISSVGVCIIATCAMQSLRDRLTPVQI